MHRGKHSIHISAMLQKSQHVTVTIQSHHQCRLTAGTPKPWAARMSFRQYMSLQYPEGKEDAWMCDLPS
jgi:hypothetical protein